MGFPFLAVQFYLTQVASGTKKQKLCVCVYLYLWSLCVCVYVYMDVFACVKVCVFMCKCVYASMPVHVCVCVSVPMYMCVCLCVHVCLCLFTCVCFCVHVCVSMCVSVCFFLVCFSIAVIKQTNKHYDQNNPGGKGLFQLVVYNPSSRECRVGIWRQEPKQRPSRNFAFWFAHMAWSTCFDYLPG